MWRTVSTASYFWAFHYCCDSSKQMKTSQSVSINVRHNVCHNITTVRHNILVLQPHFECPSQFFGNQFKKTWRTVCWLVGFVFQSNDICDGQSKLWQTIVTDCDGQIMWLAYGRPFIFELNDSSTRCSEMAIIIINWI